LKKTMLRTVALARPGVAAAVLLLGGCASFSQDGGFDSVNQLTRQRLGAEVHPIKSDDDERALAVLITQKLQQPLSVDDAVTIALLNNRGLQATYASLGIAEADLVQAGRLTNPAFGFKRTHSGDEVAIERTLTFNLLRVLTLPLAGRIESRRFEQTKLLVADAALKMAYDTRRAYFEAIAAQQSADYAGTVNAAAAAGAELATRMTRAGNWSQLDLLREQAFHVDAISAASRATKDAVAAREKLTRLLGLSGDAAQFRLPERLPDLPAAIAELPQVEQRALRDRLDVQAGQLQLQETAASLGLTKTTRFVNVLDLGTVRNSTSGQPSAPGYEVTLEIPLFDWGGTRVARAEASYLASAGRLAEIAVNARSEARESHANYRASWALARHYRDQVLPMRKRIADEMQLRYNGMLASPFALLADAREQANAGNGYITALKDYWIADTNLQAALGGQLPATQQGATP
jgi:outer membrane protein TolC